MSSRSKSEVFKLQDSDDEDYLDFADSQARASMDDAKVARSKVDAKKGSTASSTPKRSHHAKPKPRIVMADPADEQDYTPACDDTATVSKRMPLKSVQEHQLLMNQLNAFVTSARFGPILKECDIVVCNLKKKSVAELRELRERVRACCANSGGSGGVVSAITLGAVGRIEAWAPKKFMDLEGFQAEIERNPEFASLCEMIEIDSGFKSSMSPMQRMAMCIGTTALSVAATNKAKAVAQGANASLIAQLQAQADAARRADVPAAKPPSASQGPIREY